jgi:hypothetical protein
LGACNFQLHCLFFFFFFFSLFPLSFIAQLLNLFFFFFFPFPYPSGLCVGVCMGAKVRIHRMLIGVNGVSIKRTLAVSYYEQRMLERTIFQWDTVDEQSA